MTETGNRRWQDWAALAVLAALTLAFSTKSPCNRVLVGSTSIPTFTLLRLCQRDAWAGRLPLWNPTCCGSAAAGQLQAAVFTPQLAAVVVIAAKQVA